MQTLEWPLRYAAELFADREAVVDGDTRLTYAQLADRCGRMGSALRRFGIRSGDRVATLLTNSHQYLELHFAIPGIGAVAVPINGRLAIAEMEYVLRDCGARLLIGDGSYAAVLEKLQLIVERVVLLSELERQMAQESAAELPGPGSDEALAGIYYTGGTTGPAKGVMLSHRNLVMTTMHLRGAKELREGDAFLYVFPLFHLAGAAALYALTWNGMKHVVLPAVDPGLLLKTIERERITHTSVVPTVINLMLAHPAAGTTDFSSLKEILHGAAPISPELCRRAVKTFGCRFEQAYGMTEVTGTATLLHREHELLDHERIKSAGRVIPGMELVIRRPDGSRCAPREPGEITLRGPNLMLGYWNKPELTAEVVRDGWYWSGDIGWADEEHYIFVVDRVRDIINSGGEKVYSIEVENALASHPAVLECAVIGVADEKWGEAVHAVVYAKPGRTVAASDLIDHCRERIAGYKCPKAVTFVSHELPKSGVGKIMKRELQRFIRHHAHG